MTLLAQLPNILACATCYGASGDQTVVAANFAIFVMLIVLVGVLGSVFSFILYLARRQRRFAPATSRPRSPQGSDRS